MDINKAFPVTIRTTSPFRNVLKGMREINGFENIWNELTTSRVNIVLVGAGGTGGYVAAELMRFMGNLPRKIQEHIYLTVIDGDSFEEKNLTRQLCQDEDIGTNKAMALVSSYSPIYGCMSGHVIAYDQYITSAKQLLNLAYTIPTISISTDTYAKLFLIGHKVIGSGTDLTFSNGAYNITGDIVRPPENSTCGFGYYSYKGTVDRFDCGLTATNEKELDTVLKNVNLRISSIGFYGSFGTDSNGNAIRSINSRESSIRYPGPCESIIPIIIDCVDKTTVRNIIKQCVEQFRYGNKIRSFLAQRMLQIIIKDLFERFRYNGRGEFNREIDRRVEDYIKGNFTDFELGITSPDMLILSGNRKVPNNDEFDTAREVVDFSNDNHYSLCDRNVFVVPEVYLISSGNSKYTGQVAWGRYSMLYDGVSPVTYNDVFGFDESAKGTLVSTDKCRNLLEKDLKPIKKETRDYYRVFNIRGAEYGPRLINVVKIGDLDLDGTRKNTVETMVSSKAAYDILGTRYLYLSGFEEVVNAFNDTKEDGIIMDDSDANIKRFLYCGLDSLFPDTKNLCVKGDMLANALYTFNYSSFRNAVDESFQLPATYNKVFIPYALTFNNSINVSLDAATGDYIPFSKQYRNAVDYMSQYISVPLPYAYMPGLVDMDEDKREEQLSCADRAVQNVQSIQANKTAANLVMNYVTSILNGIFGLESEEYGGNVHMANYMTTFDTRENKFINSPITIDFLKEYEIEEQKDCTCLEYIYGYRDLDTVTENVKPDFVEVV